MQELRNTEGKKHKPIMANCGIRVKNMLNKDQYLKNCKGNTVRENNR